MTEAIMVDTEKLNIPSAVQKYMLKNISPRLYQETILSTCVNANCLVVLPTGMGKTLLALMLASQRFKQYPGSKMLFLAFYLYQLSDLFY